MRHLINWKMVLVVLSIFVVNMALLPIFTTKAIAAEPAGAGAGTGATTAGTTAAVTTTAAITTGTIVAAAVIAAAVVAAVVAAGAEAKVSKKCVTISGYGELCEGDNITTAVHHFAAYHAVTHATALTHVLTTLHNAGITDYTGP
ncbi:MAG: hypothetical protein HZA07_06190 [Nitrospirae bacterium]|nr:hypothetical protein [Nitrospirota bacterium]